MDDLRQYDYDLPKPLIASEPLPRRDASRLLVVDRARGSLEHCTIRDLPGLLHAGDCLVLNDTKVIPARLLGHRLETGGRWEGLFLGSTPAGDFRLICQCRGRLKAGEQISVHPAHAPHSADRLMLTLGEQDAAGVWQAEPDVHGDPLRLLEKFGTVPLPHYLGRGLAEKNDWLRYQTTYCRRPGAVAAPTAGLHLTDELLEDCRQRSIRRAFVTLHVGIGTFRPITSDRLSEHRMHSEWCEVPEQTVDQIEQTGRNGGRVVAVGTTTVRALESAAKQTRHGQQGGLQSWQGETDLFIRPPFQFRSVDVLLTNFHLPRSTLLVMVCAFAGTDLIKTAYDEAIRREYRFYSYGDAMLIV